MENGPFINGLPINNGGSFHGKLLNNQMISQRQRNHITIIHHTFLKEYLALKMG